MVSASLKPILSGAALPLSGGTLAVKRIALVAIGVAPLAAALMVPAIWKAADLWRR